MKQRYHYVPQFVFDAYFRVDNVYIVFLKIMNTSMFLLFSVHGSSTSSDCRHNFPFENLKMVTVIHYNQLPNPSRFTYLLLLQKGLSSLPNSPRHDCTLNEMVLTCGWAIGGLGPISSRHLETLHGRTLDRKYYLNGKLHHSLNE